MVANIPGIADGSESYHGGVCAVSANVRLLGVEYVGWVWPGAADKES